MEKDPKVRNIIKDMNAYLCNVLSNALLLKWYETPSTFQGIKSNSAPLIFSC